MMNLDENTPIFVTWLKHYSTEVILKVLERKDEILHNEYAMNLLKELHEREQKEHEDFSRSLNYMLERPADEVKEFDPHNHPLTHSKSYRDVLYDMYIRSI